MMDRYGSTMYLFAQRILDSYGSREDVEECVSDVFIMAWNRIDEYDPLRSSLQTWMYMLTKYRALDCRRKLTDRPQLVVIDDDLTNSDNLERTVIQKAETEEILRIVDSYGSIDRTIFYKKYYLYESLDMIASALGLTRKSVENRLRRTRNALKEQLILAWKEDISHE
ncbi:sigma-70 family RNA polymerase sigma factor [Paenibacillus qinlingensis]|uniref:sigma-70 family RNA polymerase sigma factor n=1 Tax=Paenibacillus qinlingensis TaxID=1837343 RepID=UPI00286CCDFB|nr:sigma-70 family RNA polymerase sigma factor [Paenibacillus qinlingensis]